MKIQNPFIYGRNINLKEIEIAQKNRSHSPIFFLNGLYNIYCYRNTNDEWTSGMFNDCEPRIICGPSAQGKTTKITYIQHLYKNFPCQQKDMLSLKAKNIRIQDFAKSLAEEMNSKKSNTLESIFETSSRLKKRGRLLFILDCAENLPDETLNWILSNIQYLKEKKGFLVDHRIQIIIAGRFTLKTVARGQNSPIDKLHEVDIRNFQKDEISTTLKNLKLPNGAYFTPAYISELYKLTEGNKYLVQLFCDKSWAFSSDKQISKKIDKKVLERTSRRFIEFESWKDPFINGVLVNLITSPPSPDVLDQLEKLIKSEALEWQSVRKATQKMLYNTGIVRILGREAVFQNQIIRDIIFQSVNHFHKSYFFMAEFCPTDKFIKTSWRKRRKTLIGQIKRLSFVRKLLWINYAEVVSISKEKVKLHFWDEDENEFIGTMDKRDLGGISPKRGQGLFIYSIANKTGPITKIHIETS